MSSTELTISPMIISDSSGEKICTCRNKGCPNDHSCDFCYDYTEMRHVTYGSCSVREAICLKCLLREWLDNQKSVWTSQTKPNWKDRVIDIVNEVYQKKGEPDQRPRWDDEHKKDGW